MELLTDVLNTLELKGWLSSRRELVPPWRYDFASSKDSMFHILIHGGAILQVDGAEIQLEDGDVVLFPTGQAHSLYDAAISPVMRHVHLDYNPQRGYELVNKSGETETPFLFCGAFHFDYPNDFPLLYRLPKLIHISGAQGRLDPSFSDVMNFMIRESSSQRPGVEVILRRLTELLFIQVIRLWVDQQNQQSNGWVGVLHDQPVGAALKLIHQSPERRWTVQELANAAALSRSAFSARFTEVVGEPPLTYLTRWRMLRATRLLKNEVRMEAIAEQLGYESEAAFRKAFKREVGIPPAQYRKHA